MKITSTTTRELTGPEPERTLKEWLRYMVVVARLPTQAFYSILKTGRASYEKDTEHEKVTVEIVVEGVDFQADPEFSDLERLPETIKEMRDGEQTRRNQNGADPVQADGGGKTPVR